MNPWRLIVFLMLMGTGFVLPAKGQDVDSLLFEVAEMYKDLKSYHFEGTTTVRVRRGWQTQNATYSFRIAEEFPSKFRVELDGDRARLLVANDSMTLAYHPATSEFVKRRGPIEGAGQRVDFPDVLNMYSRINELAEQVEILDADTTYLLGTDERAVYFLEVVPVATPQTQGHTILFQFMIDKETLAILRERKSTYIPDTPQGATSVTQTTTFDIARVSEDIADSMFVYVPPVNAERVTKIDAFPNFPVSLHGQRAPSFTLPLLGEERELALDALSNRIVVLNFWATWCAPCRAEMGALNQLEQEWKEAGLVVVAINVEESPDVAAPYIEEENFEFNVVLDQFGLVSRQMNVYELPTTFILDRDGIIQEHLIGARTEEDFKTLIQRYLSDIPDGD